jgi:hypothetical protein
MQVTLQGCADSAAKVAIDRALIVLGSGEYR